MASARPFLAAMSSMARPTFSARLLPAVATTLREQAYTQQHRTFRTMPIYYQQTTQSASSNSPNPVASIMSQSASPSGQEAADPEENKHAAFLGEADSDDGFEAHRDAHGKVHESMDGKNSAFLGEADSDDGFESHKDVEGDNQPALDAKNAAYLGEADSDDAFEADFDENPDKHDHKIADSKNAAFLGEGDSNDGHEADREINPDKYSHNISETVSSGQHGEVGHHDQ